MTGRPYVIMVTHDSAAQVVASLDALAGCDVDVEVVDNASVDTTCAVVHENFPWVRLRPRRDNPGFAVAVNQALRSAPSHGVVILVNPDCVVGPGTVRALVGHLADHPGAGVVAPRLLDATGAATVSAHPFESLASVVASRFGAGLLPAAVRRWLGGAARRRTFAACHQGDRPQPVDWVSGACLAVRTDLLRQVGGLDERYFLYYEDEELCLQVQRSGYEVVLLPTVVATHLGGASSEPGATWPHLYRSMLIFFGQHHPGRLPALRTVLLIRSLLGVALAGARLLGRRRGAGRRLRAWWAVAGVALTFGPAVRPGSGRPARLPGPGHGRDVAA